MNAFYKKGLAAALATSTVALAPTATMAANAKICWEAELKPALASPVVKVPPVPKVDPNDALRPDFSGAGYVAIPWDQNKSKGKGGATYKIKVTTPGNYYLWARTFWANGCGNSISVSVNGAPGKILGEDGTYNKWHWVGGTARVALKAGVNTVKLQNRETGICVDQFFLSQDKDYTPTGKRKANVTPL